MKAKDANDQLRDGTLPTDPFDGAAPVSPESDFGAMAHGARAASPNPATPVERPAQTPVLDLERDAPTLASAYGIEQLDADLNRDLVSLATLPSWPGGPPTGHGWGDELDLLLGRGVCPPYLATLGAASAGAGKTAFVQQLVDGLALRNEMILKTSADGPLTPIMILSELSAAALAWRSLSRWTGHPASVFRAGRSADPSAAKVAHAAAREALTGDLGLARRWQRYWRRGSTAKELLSELAELIEAWRANLAAKHKERTVWPVILIDPVQRFAGYAVNEVEAVNGFTTGLKRLATEKEWIVLVTSDTNKATATGAGRIAKDKARSLAEEGAAAFRGTYVLIHMSDAVLYLRRDPNDAGKVEVVVVKNLWGGAAGSVGNRARLGFRWDGASMRLEPAPISDENQGDAHEVPGRPSEEDCY